MDEHIEEDNKMDVAGTVINIACVKEELCDFEESVVAEIKQEIEPEFVDINAHVIIKCNSDLLEERVKMEENIKQEKIVQIIYEDDLSDMSRSSSEDICCEECGADYDGYCCNCPTLSHIFNNILIKTELTTKTIPSDILEIRQLSNRHGIFALKNLPQNLIFGPFEGISSIESTSGHMWKIKDKKLVNVESGNWMKYIACAYSDLLNNLEIFQFNGNLYFQTNKKIEESEELAVYYNKKKIQISTNSDEEEEGYYVPELVEKSQEIFACCFCCLGFNNEKSLVEHKTKCSHSNGADVEESS